MSLPTVAGSAKVGAKVGLAWEQATQARLQCHAALISNAEIRGCCDTVPLFIWTGRHSLTPQ